MSLEDISVVRFALERGELARLYIRGKSMAPVLRDGMVAEVEPLLNAVKPGDMLVYDTGGMLVAHRFIGRLSSERFLLCGDAYPKMIEHISRKHILGRVRRVLYSDTPQASAIPNWQLRVAGLLMMRSRALRATMIRMKEMYRYLRHRRQTQSFSNMCLAVCGLMNGRWVAGIEIIEAFTTRDFFDICARHGFGGILYRLLERACDAGCRVRLDLFEGLRSGRWMSAMRSDEILARADEVQKILTSAGIDAIFLKGAARLLRAEVDADIHFSSDVDVIVPEQQADAAVEVLRLFGYDHHVSSHERNLYRRRRQHRAPLWNSDAVIPIEIHTRLSVPGSVSTAYDYQTLLPLSEVIDSRIGRVRVLNRVGSALHLAYHGRECRVLRDAYLLAQLLRDMSIHEYVRFLDLVRAERRDGVRLMSFVGLAHRFAGKTMPMTTPQVDYLIWVSFREDLPLMFQKRAHILEGIYARCLPPYQGIRHIAAHVYTWVYNIIATPLLVAWYRRYCKASARPFLGMFK